MSKNSLTEIKKNTIDIAEKRIFQMREKGEIDLPEDYSVGNALKSAWLVLQETKDRNKKPVLQSCTRTSIVNALLDTAIQGLNPSKDQAYYVAYGKKLTMMRSYFGDIALAKRVGVKDVNPEIIYEGDKVKVEVNNGNRQVVAHETSWDNQDDDKVKGGYIIVTFTEDDGRPDKHTIMTLNECKQAWKQGQTYGKYEGTPHENFTAEMVKKTLVHRALKPLIKGSSDSYLFRMSIDRSSDIMTEHDVKEEIEEKNASESIDIDVEDAEDIDMYEEPEDEPEKDYKDDTADNFDKEVEDSLKEEPF